VNIKAIGENLTKYRSRAGLTMEGLALKSGVAKNAINALENGRGNPTVKTLDALSRTLGVTLHALMGAQEGRSKPSPSLGIAEVARLLTALSMASAPRRALILALLYRDESYLDALPRELAPAARALAKVP
jgi:transcriptional regulator with XRE-family HTH domain